MKITDASKLYLGDSQVSRVYAGAEQVWPWSPVQVPGLLGWFDGADATKVVIAGSGVSQWLNKARGSSFTLTQTVDSFRPSYVNGAVVIHTSKILRAANSPVAYDFFVVGKPDPVSTGEWRTLLFNSSANHQVIIESGSVNLGTYEGGFWQGGANWLASPTYMTANNAPAPFVAAASSEFTGGGYEAFRAFDGDPLTCWHTGQPLTTEGTSFIKIDLGAPSYIASYTYQARNGTVYHCWKDWILFGTNDLVNWTAISTVVNEPDFTVSEERQYICDKPGSYRWLQWNITKTGGAQGIYCEAGGLKVFGSQIVSPTNMTSDTAPAPYSVFESTTWPDPNTEAFRSFDGIPATNSHGGQLSVSGPHVIQIDLGSPTYVSFYRVQGRTPTFAQAWKDWTFQGSNDGSNWTTLHTVTGAAPMTKPSEWRTHYCTATGTYRWYRWRITASQSTHTEQAALHLYTGLSWGPVDGMLYGLIGTTRHMLMARDGGPLFSTGTVKANTAINFVGGFSDTAQTGASQGFGEVRELVLLPQASSNDTRQRLEGYAAHKWGLQGLLPASHPYKSAPP